MKKLALAAALSLAATSAFAGGIEPVTPEAPVVEEASSSSNGGLIVPLLLLVLVAVAASS